MSRVTILTGGVGGAKLVLGLMHAVDPASITAIVNTGDDFRHFGLAVSPDIDTLLYTLADKSNKAQGWGREGETWSFMKAATELGAEGWFNLGDGDLALHVLRTEKLANGTPLSVVIRDFACAWGIVPAILPMTDDEVATCPVTEQGEMTFQRYFVQHRSEPKVSKIHFKGAAKAKPAPGVLDAIAGADIILIAPSNPYLSVDPLLAVPAIRAALENAKAPIVAVSPIVGGEAVKGPTSKLMQELGLPVDNATIARHYAGIIDGLVIHEGDAAPAGVEVAVTDTLMKTLDDKVRVAKAALAVAERIGR